MNQLFLHSSWHLLPGFEHSSYDWEKNLIKIIPTSKGLLCGLIFDSCITHSSKLVQLLNNSLGSVISLKNTIVNTNIEQQAIYPYWAYIICIFKLTSAESCFAPTNKWCQKPGVLLIKRPKIEQVGITLVLPEATFNPLNYGSLCPNCLKVYLVLQLFAASRSHHISLPVKCFFFLCDKKGQGGSYKQIKTIRIDPHKKFHYTDWHR